MTPETPTSDVCPSEFFRVNPALLRRLPAVGKRRSKLKAKIGVRLSPKLDLLVLLALFSQAARQPKSELTIAPPSGDQMAAVAFSLKRSAVLTDLGYTRSGPDFSASAWATLNESLTRLATTRVQIRFMRRVVGAKGLEPAIFSRPLVEFVEGDRSRVQLYAYSPPGDRYFVLMPRRLLALRPALSEGAVRLLCWLYTRHRGARKDGKLKHNWRVTVTAEQLVEAKFLSSSKLRRAVELKRVRDGFANLERLGLLSIAGESWPFSVQLSPNFFHQEDIGD